MPLRLRMDTVLAKAKKAGDGSVFAVARRIGVNHTTLGRLSKGQSEPSLQTLWTLRRVYGIPMDDLVYERPALPPEEQPRTRRNSRGRKQPVRS
ncbi:helix-turn-helix domain-containing protein [Streptomyces sp. NPDC102487]|uniref:helix-turn-helix domain-containing protein n=1 Tax=Streptomyces sp. NPDC102487 TaxID=3366182 RepID=UPI0038016658